MSRPRSIPLSADRATFEAFEERVETAALHRHLAGPHDAPDGDHDRREPAPIPAPWAPPVGDDAPPF